MKEPLEATLLRYASEGVPLEEVLEKCDYFLKEWFKRDFPSIAMTPENIATIRRVAAEWNEETRSPYSDAERFQDRLTYANESGSNCDSWNDHY